jgi:hypothetical protein
MVSVRPESLEQFYSHKFDVMPETDNNDIGSFDVFDIEERVISGTTSPTFVRRDFYKIMLFQGKNTFQGRVLPCHDPVPGKRASGILCGLKGRI